MSSSTGATASHGVTFDQLNTQFSLNGAILCAGWPGSNQTGDALISPQVYLSADDITPAARLLGSIFVLLSGYSAGTDPDQFTGLALQEEPSNKLPEVAQLPQRLLGHPGGGALAVIGQLTNETIVSVGGPGQPLAADTLVGDLVQQLLAGKPVGFALEDAALRYAELAASLNDEVEDIKFGKQADERTLAALALATNAARSLVLLGDPAARLVLGPADAQPDRPTLTPTTTKGPTPTDPSRGVPPTVGQPTPPTPNIPDPAQPGPATTGEVTFGGSAVYGDISIHSTYYGSNPAVDSLQQRVIERLSAALLATLADAMVARVETYVAPAPTQVDVGAGDFSAARLLAATRVQLSSDTALVLPEAAPEVERDLLRLHQETVQIALSERTRLIEVLARIVLGLSGDRL